MRKLLRHVSERSSECYFSLQHTDFFWVRGLGSRLPVVPNVSERLTRERNTRAARDSRVLRVSRGARFSPARFSLAETGDYSQANEPYDKNIESLG